MRFQSHRRIGVTAFVVGTLFFGCGDKPAPTEEQTAALLRGGPPLFVRECERLLKDCDRLHRPRLRDACVWEVLRGECGHPPRRDAGRIGMDGPASVPEAGMRDSGLDVGRDSGICDPSKTSCNRDAGKDAEVHGPEAGASDGAADVRPDSGASCLPDSTACGPTTEICCGGTCLNGRCCEPTLGAACGIGAGFCCSPAICQLTTGLTNGVCVATCSADGALCAGLPCCSGAPCIQGVCGGCDGVGESCTSAQFGCCPGTHCGGTTCMAGAACVASGQPCPINAQSCCSGSCTIANGGVVVCA
jgi:hypothetical protein